MTTVNADYSWSLRLSVGSRSATPGEWARSGPSIGFRASLDSPPKLPRTALPQVLERYVPHHPHGVPKLFLEGGLSRDGRFRPPKLGLLDYILGAKRDRSLDRPLTIIPVAINYDRVLEDRSLLREIQQPQHRLSRLEQMEEVASYVTKVSLRFLVRRALARQRAPTSWRPSTSRMASSPSGRVELLRAQARRIHSLADESWSSRRRYARDPGPTSPRLSCASPRNTSRASGSSASMRFATSSGPKRALVAQRALRILDRAS